MPSTAVHLALAALIAAALLGTDYDARALGVVLALAALPDLDTFIGIAVLGTHRAALHSVVIPAIASGLLVYDTRFRRLSFVRQWGDRGVRIAWVGIGAYVFAGIGPDLFFNGVNLFYPFYDRFFELSGNLLISNQRGFVQTIWEGAGPARTGEPTSVVGTTETVHYTTGVDVEPGPDPEDAERVFPIARGGLQVLILLTAVVVTSVRLWEVRRARPPAADR